MTILGLMFFISMPIINFSMEVSTKEANRICEGVGKRAVVMSINSSVKEIKVRYKCK